jgi:hypothetical protein
MTTKETKERIIEVLNKLPPESLEGVLEYVEFIAEPEAVEATAEELEAIRRGDEEYRKGEFIRWRDLKRDAPL